MKNYMNKRLVFSIILCLSNTFALAMPQNLPQRPSQMANNHSVTRPNLKDGRQIAAIGTAFFALTIPYLTYRLYRVHLVTK